jgi:hypothetical protein
MSNFPAVVGGVGSINPAAIRAVYIREQGGKWQTLGSIKDGEINVDDFVNPDSLDQNKANGAFQFSAKASMKQASLTEIALLATIVNGNNDFLFKLADAGAIPTGSPGVTAGWVIVTADQVGVEGDLVCDGTPKDDQKIDLRWQGTALLTSKPAMLKASIEDTYFASSADSATAVFYAIGTYSATLNGGLPTNSHILPCGVASITLQDVAGGTAKTIKPITGVKMTFKMLSTQDDLMRFLPNSVDIAISYSWMASDAADLIVLNQMSILDVNVVITMLNTRVFTLNNLVGIQTKFIASGGMSKTRFVDFTHVGKILQASLSGVVS